jgi:hypothetical protein
MQPTTQPEPARKRTGGRGKHLAYARKVTRTHQWQATKRGAFGHAIDALFPWPWATYPGKIKGTLAVLAGRITAAGLKHWARGANQSPPWAHQLLATAIERRIAELQHALELIKKEAGD